MCLSSPAKYLNQALSTVIKNIHLCLRFRILGFQQLVRILGTQLLLHWLLYALMDSISHCLHNCLSVKGAIRHVSVACLDPGLAFCWLFSYFNVTCSCIESMCSCTFFVLNCRAGLSVAFLWAVWWGPLWLEVRVESVLWAEDGLLLYYTGHFCSCFPLTAQFLLCLCPCILLRVVWNAWPPPVADQDKPLPLCSSYMNTMEITCCDQWM